MTNFRFFSACLLFALLGLAGCRVKKFPPELLQITPNAARIGQEVTMLGAQFGNEPTVSFGQSGTFVAGIVTNSNDQTLKVVIPRMPLGPTQVRVANTEGTADPLSFTVLQPAPSLTAVLPGNGLAGTSVVLQGDFLDQLKSVKFGMVVAPVVGSPTGQSLTVTVPTTAKRGPQLLTIETDGGAATADFIVAGTPTITGFTPKRPQPNTELALQGRNFTDGVVRINGLLIAPAQTRVTDTEIKFLVPLAATNGKITVTVFDKLIATSTDSLLIAFPPAIISLSPTEGIKGDKILATGRALKDITSAAFGGLAAPFRIINDTQIEITLPDRTTSGEVQLTVGGIGGTATSLQSVLFILPPANLVVTPERTARNRELTITGQNLNRITAVTVNGKATPITSFFENANIKVNVPADAVSGAVTVSNRAGTGTAAKPITVVLKAVITDFTKKALVGSRMIIKGEWLLNANVVFAGTSNGAVFDGKNTDTEIWVKVPDNAQNGPIRITNEAAELTITDPFTALRQISGVDFTPKSGKVATEITITGQNLTDVTDVRFTGSAASAVFRLSGSNLIATVPADAQTGTLVLTNGAGDFTTTQTFTVLRPPTNVTFTPVAAKIGAEITISGQNLASTTDVRFTGSAASAVFRLSGNSLIATVPADAQTGPIRITNAADPVTTTQTFTVLRPPAGLSFTPTSGIAGATITISGQNLATVTDVRFTGSAASAGFRLSGSSLVVTVPADAKDGPICLTNDGGQTCTTTSFNVLLPPKITAFTPALGPVGTEITISGQNLATVTDVRFTGSISSAVFRLSGSSLVVTVPAGAADGPICLTNDGGKTCTTASFNVLLPPRITAFAPATGPEGTVITLTGQNLATVTKVQFGTGKAGGTVVTAVFQLSGSALLITVPVGVVDGTICLTNDGGTTCSSTGFVVTP
jgi:hypothetical protein